ncbi:MAG: heme-binding domain-containing protein [Chitinophagaceae bacterium]
MSRLTKILLVLLPGVIAIQFIKPARNISGQVSEADITKRFNVPANVEGILNTSCSDCHSNNTRYPWYANIQPMGWLLANHIKEGKAELNFSEFGNYSGRRQLSKLKAIGNSVKDGSMPLSSYTLIHRNAKLSKENKVLIIEWAARAKDSLETN